MVGFERELTFTKKAPLLCQLRVRVLFGLCCVFMVAINVAGSYSSLVTINALEK